jgi:hypothetical protein
MTTIVQRATRSSLLLVSPLLHGSLIGNDETRSESAWGRFHLRNKKTPEKRVSRHDRQCHPLPTSKINDAWPFHANTAHPYTLLLCTPRETTVLVEEINEFDSILTKNGPVPFCGFHVNRPLLSSFSLDSACCSIIMANVSTSGHQ